MTLRVECRSTCCQIDYDDASLSPDELQSSAGIPLGNSMLFMEDRIVSCFLPDEPFPPADFIDRLDERIAVDPVFRAAEASCRTAAGGPGTLQVGLAIGRRGDFKLHLSGDIQATVAAACVEDTLYDRLRFAPAAGNSSLDVTLTLGKP
jgi:hypothetical protein